MKNTQRHRGFVLLIVVTLIPLVGLAILISTQQTTGLSRRLKLTERQHEQKNLLYSARAWLSVHREDVLTLENGQMLTIPVTDIASGPTVCTAEIIDRRGDGTAVRLTLAKDQSPQTAMAQQSFFLAAD